MNRLKTYNNLLYNFLIKIPSGVNVLDIGCGTTSVFETIKVRKKLHVVGIDILDKLNISYCIDEYYKVDLNNQIPIFKTKLFDAVYCNHVLEHLKNYEHLQSILRNNVKKVL